MGLAASEYLKIQGFHFFSVALVVVSWMSSKFGQIRPQTTESAATECLKYNVKNGVFTFSSLFSYLRTVY